MKHSAPSWWLLALVTTLVVGVVGGCRKPKENVDELPVPAPPALPDVPPPAFGAPGSTSELPPAAPEAGASTTPLGQADEYYKNGQYWMARLVIENQAMSPASKPEETELLAKICVAQGDRNCVAACSKKLGRKIDIDGGGGDVVVKEDAVTAEELIRKGKIAEARTMLEGKVLSDMATPKELKSLKAICTKQGDKMCIALCNAKLR